MSAPAVLQALRAATGELHRRLDSQLPIAGAEATLQDYLAHLQLLRPWLQALRAAIAGPGDAGLDAVARRIDGRLQALQWDLADAGEPQRERAGVEDFVPPSPGAALAYAWGLAYVVEGSQLGGAVMRRRLLPRLAPHPLCYFAPAEGRGPASGWQDFIAELAAAVDGQAAVEAAASGAVAAFERLLAQRARQAPNSAAPPEARLANICHHES
ncbi:biliverdin-producing heme oxygenase [Variovorax saccharolyticus]|uniref:biliverdin-producing heme oxygenase n=1 Tax=Variovorax saccharolyticus TaxID=3053516 RepID=UPI00257698D4|nr:biliverdin-producing heme oxygenase [Variovorax sp. J22R187]MDM0019533.1 biliverdin-producing heme oxygenase [Variovorax sp. J22R187]